MPDGSTAVIDDPTAMTPTGSFPPGSTRVSLTVFDGQGGEDTDEVLVAVRDTTPPLVSCATDIEMLWPPNHAMRRVQIVVDAADAGTDTGALVVECRVSSSEPDLGTDESDLPGDVDGQDGFTAPVTVILSYDSALESFRGSMNLRAEREGGDDGRAYSITCAVTDASGNTASDSCAVIVPHDRSGM